MAHSPSMTMVLIALLAQTTLCFSKITNGGYLYPQFYDQSCPQVTNIVRTIVAQAVAQDPRMAASLLRLHFHDCFVKGCDASILLDSGGTRNVISEKGSIPNSNSARGFEVIDEIKAALEAACPQTVSCADILALAARDSTVSGGPSWEVPVGRRDSFGASLHGSNHNIPAPNNTFETILTKFKIHGLNMVDLVALSGSHTIGNARCTSFKQRLYGNTRNEHTDRLFDAQLRVNCRSRVIVKEYAANQDMFFEQFAKSMTKMGNISPLTGFRGQIRKTCRNVDG
ncbi:hypothetical protein L1987_66320 [Smallanthus sonchifolius]|uniref:Uncharacterized protein n=1 Tax=Smallanthus sonchifolius TaxID=185202 RepID=A0ACB9BX51_9ASTR|nr:hypothetical protein L1987_66320 [Smallanthus sonchifolius]